MNERKNMAVPVLSAAGSKTQYDEYVKRILGSRQVLARILKGAVPEYNRYSIDEIIQWIEPDLEIADTPPQPGGKNNFDTRITGEIPKAKYPEKEPSTMIFVSALFCPEIMRRKKSSFCLMWRHRRTSILNIIL